MIQIARGIHRVDSNSIVNSYLLEESGEVTADVGHARASLARIEHVDAALMLPGHGEPWTEGPAAALRRARESWAN